MGNDSELIGRTIAGRFKITGIIGEGAMAFVYRAEQERAPREVAVKVMHPNLASDAIWARRFRREAKAALRLRHPSIVRVLDFGVERGLTYIAMEYVAGRDLFDVLVAQGKLSGTQAARILIPVCEALAEAHAEGIVHRDLKPENVMLVNGADPKNPVVKVLDFGIAKTERLRVDQSGSFTALTHAGAALGTPEYMSPEQCEGAPVDGRSDVYACGGVLYQLVTGRPPFGGESALAMMLQHLRDSPMPPSKLARDLPPNLEAVILKALSKAPSARQQSARELAAELTEALRALEQPRPHSAHGLEPPRTGIEPSDEQTVTEGVSMVDEVSVETSPQSGPVESNTLTLVYSPPERSESEPPTCQLNPPNGALLGTGPNGTQAIPAAAAAVPLSVLDPEGLPARAVANLRWVFFVTFSVVLLAGLALLKVVVRP